MYDSKEIGTFKEIKLIFSPNVKALNEIKAYTCDHPNMFLFLVGLSHNAL